jgi:hypothetical protein
MQSVKTVKFNSLCELIRLVMLKTTLCIYCVLLFMNSLVISVPAMGAEYNYEVSGGESRNNQSGISRMVVIGGIVQQPRRG